jgi:hypothetical protein
MPLVLNGTTGVQDNSRAFVRATVVTASGAFVDFTGIPSWVKRITVMLAGVSTSGTSSLIVRIGDSGGIVSTGYQGVVAGIVSTSVSTGTTTTGFLIGGASATNQAIGNLILTSAVLLCRNSHLKCAKTLASAFSVGKSV